MLQLEYSLRCCRTFPHQSEWHMYLYDIAPMYVDNATCRPDRDVWGSRCGTHHKIARAALSDTVPCNCSKRCDRSRWNNRACSCTTTSRSTSCKKACKDGEKENDAQNLSLPKSTSRMHC